MLGIVSATLSAIIFIPPVFATGEATCQSTSTSSAAGELGSSAGYIEGTRATIEGQSLPLCTGSAISGSFQWAAMDNLSSVKNIMQIGYGRCANANNNLGLGTVCNGNYYYYWAWGSDCGGIITGSDPSWGPVALRIGAALASPPATSDYYVIRENVGGIEYYDGYVNGSLLTGVDALGNTVSARVPASVVCWDGDQTNRRFVLVWRNIRHWRLNGWLDWQHKEPSRLQPHVVHGWVRLARPKPGAEQPLQLPNKGPVICLHNCGVERHLCRYKPIGEVKI
jgi:hypothetical protein